MAHVCIGDSPVKVIYYKHTINVYHAYVWIQECGNYIRSIIIIIILFFLPWNLSVLAI